MSSCAPPISQDETVGSLDLGGASAEIAFEVPFNSSTTTASEKLFNREYHLYARSYLCYGQTEAHARFLAHLHSNVCIHTCHMFTSRRDF